MIDWSAPLARGSLLAALVVFTVLAYRVWKWTSLRRSSLRMQAVGRRQRDQVSVLYFSGPNCAQCVAQESVVKQLRSERPDLAVEMYDASVDRA